MGNFIYLIIMCLGAVIFIAIGIYAMHREKPMWFWTDSKVPESKIRDVKAYNRANGKMWCVYSVPLFISVVVMFFFPVLSIVILALNGTVGIGGMVWYYHKLEEKYFK